MKKPYFIKEFQMARRLQRVMVRVIGETDQEYELRTRRARYGIEGEDRVNFQLEKLRLPLVCLSHVRIETGNEKAEADFLVICKDCIYLVESKNWYGHIRITDNNEVIRLIPRKNMMEEEGVGNPFTQVEIQAGIFTRYLRKNGFNVKIKPLIVMSNPKTVLYGKIVDSLFKYDKIKDFFEKKVTLLCDDEEYQKMIEIGEFLNYSHKERDFNDFPSMKHRFENAISQIKLIDENDLKLYEELLEFRRKLANELNWPLCNLFLNQDAENMVKIKPLTKEEFVKIPGLKERKYNLFGEQVIAIIRKYVK